MPRLFGPRKTLAPSELFIEMVDAYRKRQDYKSWSRACIELATIGLINTGIIPYKSDALESPPWGGPREPKD